MIFAIKCVNPGNANIIENWLFDNSTNKIIAPNGLIKSYWNDPRFYGVRDIFRKRPANKFSKGNPIVGKENRLNKLKIQLGFGCNLHCKYCLQGRFRQDLLKQASREDVELFVDSLIKNNIKINRGGVIEFWGGEPLVYIKTLKLIIPLLRKVYGWDIQFKMYTNGILLTDLIVDFLIDNKVRVLISHDGPGQNLRSDSDPLDDQNLKNVWLRLLEKSKLAGLPLEFRTVITSQTVEFLDVYRYFDEKFCKGVKISFEGIVKADESNIEYARLDNEHQLKLVASEFNEIVGGGNNGLKHWADDLLGRLVHRVPISCMGSRCEAPDPAVLTLSLDGRVCVCHNRPVNQFSIGNVNDLKNTRNGFLNHWSCYGNCCDCLVISSCKGGCPINDNREHEISCENEFIFHSGIFSAVWFLLTNRIIVEVCCNSEN